MTKAEITKALEVELAKMKADPKTAKHAIRAAENALVESKRADFAPGVSKL
jgi:hypothetical protein